MNKKGLNATITLIIAIVVMVIVALALIAITTGNLGSFGADVQEKTETGFQNMNLESEAVLKAKCIGGIGDESYCNTIGGSHCVSERGKCKWQSD